MSIKNRKAFVCRYLNTTKEQTMVILTDDEINQEVDYIMVLDLKYLFYLKNGKA